MQGQENKVVFLWRDMTQLIDPHNKTKREIQTHTPPRLPPRSDHPRYLWDTWLSFIFSGSTYKSSRQRNRTFVLCLVLLLLSRLRESLWLERVGIGAALYRLAVLAVTFHEPMIVPPKTRVTEK